MTMTMWMGVGFPMNEKKACSDDDCRKQQVEKHDQIVMRVRRETNSYGLEPCDPFLVCVVVVENGQNFRAGCGFLVVFVIVIVVVVVVVSVDVLVGQLVVAVS